MLESNHIVSITLKEEETIQQILAETGHVSVDLDEQLSSIIQQGQQQFQANYQAQAEERMLRNRQGINFQQLKQTINLDFREQANCQPSVCEQSELNVFQKQYIRKSKIMERQILDLDGQLPKLNFTGMVGQQQRIFGLKPTIACNYLQFKKITSDLIKQAVSCKIGDSDWLFMGIRNDLVIFMGQNSVQPVIMGQAGVVTALGVSPCRKYVGIGVQNRLIIYQIRKNSNLILLKNFPDLNVGKIVQIIFYQGQGPKLFFIDEKYRVVLVNIELGLILTKVKIQQICHQLKRVDSCAVTRINPSSTMMVVSGAGSLKLVTVDPEILFMEHLIMSDDNVQCIWRKNKDKIQLIAACDNKVSLYKLQFSSDGDCYYLQQHLLYLNHYSIQKIFLISQHHVLLQSSHNFTVVGLPLIPSVLQDPQLTQSQAAIVFVFSRQSNRVVEGVDEGILLMWNQKLQMGRLRSLQQQLDQLMVQKSAYRQAFSLLVLVSKGMNYSFRFSYQPEDLKRLIYAAIEVSASTLIPLLDIRIVQFRVGWVVQLCIECHQQLLLWVSFYPKLKEKHLQRSLFQMVQIFILKGQLTNIPQQIFLDIVSYYAEKGQSVVIQKLVLSNKQQYQATRLLSLLNQKQMNYLQFYLFSRGILSEQCDFYTPFLRSFTAFTRNQQAHSIKTNENGLLCYWILTKTFNFEHVPSGQMTRDTKITVATNFFIQVLAKTFIRKLADFNLRYFLQAMLIPFLNTQFKDILIEEETQVISKLKDYSGEANDAPIDAQFVTIFLNHVQNSIGLSRSSSLFAQFYGTVLYLTYSTAKFQRIIQIMATLFQKRFYHYQLRIAIGERPPTAKLKEYLINLVKKDLMQRQDRLYIKKLLAFEDRQIGYLLHKIDKNYTAALQQYLGNYGPKGIYDFAAEIHQQIQKLSDQGAFLKERKKLQVRNFLVRNVGLLFRTNSSAALQLFYLIGQTTKRIHDIIFNGHYQQHQKLHFLTAVLTKWQNQQFELKQQYLLEHLEEVCGLPQQEMRSYLDKFYYPLDHAIRVADQRGNYLAKAILQARSGLIELAFASYEKLIRGTLLGKEGEEQTRSKVSRYIDQCVVLCKLYSGQSLQQNLWVKLIRFITSFVASQHQYKVYLKVELERANQSIIAQMLRFLSTTLLISYFTSPQIPLPAHKLLPIHGELFRAVKFDKLNFQRGLLIFRKDLQNLRITINKQNKIAVGLTKICDFCREALQEQQKSISYSCGHSFHKICHDDTSICLSCSYESDDSLIFKAIFKKGQNKKQDLSKTREKKKIQLDVNIYVQTQAQARNEAQKKRLKLYDFEQGLKNDQIYSLTNKSFKLQDLILQ